MAIPFTGGYRLRITKQELVKAQDFCQDSIKKTGRYPGRVALAQALDIPETRARKIIDRIGDSLTPEATQIEVFKLRKALRQKEAELKEALENQVIGESFERFIEKIGNIKANPPKWMVAAPPKSSKIARPSAFFSDAHWDEVVNPEEIEWMNGYDREIALSRTERFFRNTIRLGRDYLKGLDFDGIVMPVGGDLFSGSIHEELNETNEDTLYGSFVAYIDPMVAGIRLFAEEFGRVYVPCVVGNHPRRTKKPRHKKSVRDNLEWLFYKILQRELAGDKRVDIAVSESHDIDWSIWGTRYRMTHGDQFRGGSGIAGALCMDPGTKILLSNLDYVDLGDVKPGDALVGFEEQAEPGKRRSFEESTVEEIERNTLECVEIETDDGQKTICSLEHPFLTRSSTAHSWSRAENLHVGSRILSLGPVWSRRSDYESGYLAGILDGEGHIEVGANNARIGFAKQNNACLDTSLAILGRLGIPYTSSISSSSVAKGFEAVHQVRLFGGLGKSTYNILRLLGEISPKRLLAEKGRQVWDGRSVQICMETKVVGIRYLGHREVVSMKTSTATFVGNGLLTHNSPLMLGDARKKKRSQAAGRPYDYLLAGHWHQYFPRVKGMIVNSSLKGYDEYAYDGNFDFEKPSQSFWLTDPEDGVTIMAPIHVQGKDEWWIKAAKENKRPEWLSERVA